jgi:hypothetical protein
MIISNVLERFIVLNGMGAILALKTRWLSRPLLLLQRLS